MVQELDWAPNSPRRSRAFCRGRTVSHPSQKLNGLPSAEIPILFRTRTPVKPTGESSEDESSNFPPAIKEACYFLAAQVKLLRKNAQVLERIDPLTTEVTRELEIYCKAILLEPLENDASFRANHPNQPLSLNLNTVFKLARAFAQEVPENEAGVSTGQALTIFLCHEISHISQGLKDYENVQRMKNIGERNGRACIGKLDLRSDFLAAHTLSYTNSLKTSYR